MPITSTSLTTRSRFALFILLMVSLASFYMMTYSGQIEIADQLLYFDATSSFVNFGDIKSDESMWQYGTTPRSFPRRESNPLREINVEPGMIAAAAPLYWLSAQSDGIGLVHSVYLFNVLVTAGLGGVFFWYALILGYREGTAIAGALALGLLTILLPYSQTFFREPLMMMLLTLCGLTLEAWRQRGSTAKWTRHAMSLFIAAGFFLASAATKDAAVLALPALLMIVTPDKLWRSRFVKRTSDVLLIALIAGTVFIATTDILTWLNPTDETIPLIGAFVLETEFTRTALHTYLLSLGGSVWGTSPILLLALPGAWLLWKQGNRRLIWVGVLMVLGFAYAYALLRGVEWFGGTIWPQRFLMPVLPFAMLLTLPMIEEVFKSRRRSLIALAGLLIVYSAWWQFSGVSYRWFEYSNATFELSAGGLVYWGPGFNDLRYIRPVVLAGLWGEKPLNFAWVRTQQWGLPLMFVAIMAVCGWGIFLIVRRDTARRVPTYRIRQIVPFVLSMIFILAVYITLRLIYVDSAYRGENTALHRMVDEIRTEVEPGEFVLMADREYSDFLLNYGKIGERRLVGFPFHPGDRGSCDQPLQVESENPEALLEAYSAPIVHHLADHHPRLWLLVSSGPEIPCVVRPMERMMGMRYYRVSEHQTAPTVRLLEFQTSDAPDPFAFRGADTAVDLRYAAIEGSTLELTGLTLPQGESYHAGDWLPLSLYWQSDQMNTRDYTVAWFVADAGGVKAQGEDSWFGATFFPTSLWKAAVPVWDNRALRLPADLPPSEYQLWLKVYWQDVHTGKITDLPVTGGETASETIGVLPVTLKVILP